MPGCQPRQEAPSYEEDGQGSQEAASRSRRRGCRRQCWTAKQVQEAPANDARAASATVGSGELLQSECSFSKEAWLAVRYKHVAIEQIQSNVRRQWPKSPRARGPTRCQDKKVTLCSSRDMLNPCQISPGVISPAGVLQMFSCYQSVEIVKGRPMQLTRCINDGLKEVTGPFHEHPPSCSGAPVMFKCAVVCQ